MRANENLHCFIPCSQYKIDAGQCGCHNRIGLLDDKQIKEEDEQQEENSEIPED